MGISDWSSDVCSADLAGGEGRKPASELADRGAERRDDRGATQLHGDKLLLFGCFFLEVRSRVRAGQRPPASRAGIFPSDIRGCGRGRRSRRGGRRGCFHRGGVPAPPAIGGRAGTIAVSGRSVAGGVVHGVTLTLKKKKT